MVDVAVVGGGLGGLAAALLSARRGHRVTVLERDPPPPRGAGPDDDFLRWSRPGVPHCRQGHAFLGLSTRVLRAEAPDVVAALRARGAPEVPIAPGAGETTLLCRRLVYEAVLRRVVEAEPGVEVHARRPVTGVEARPDGPGGVPRVTGVRTRDGEVVAADVVVDATGRRSRAPQWLREAGARRVPDNALSCGFSYLTRHYRLRAGAAFPAEQVPIVAELDYATALAFPGDNGRYHLSVAVATRDPLRHRLREPAAYERVLASVPAIAPWLACGEPTEEPQPMGRIENRFRRLVDAGGPAVTGLVLLADAAVQTNPTFGRGVSLAFRHAQGLAGLLERAAADPHGFAGAFDEWTVRELGGWFDLQVATDTARTRQLEESMRGGRAGAASDTVSRFVAAMALLRDDDAGIRAASDRVYHMLMTPGELMADRALARRLLAFLREHPDAETPTQGPDRDGFERLVGAHG